MARRHTWAGLALSAVALAGVGCGDDGETPRSGGGDRLLGAWTVRSLHDGNAREPVVEGTELTADFADDRISGNGGCNTFSAGYRTDGDAIEIDPIASTKIACVDPAHGEQEQRYFAALEEVETFQVRDGQLSLLGPGGDVLVELDRRD